MASEDAMGYFNQIKGIDMTAHFDSSELHRVDVYENGNSIYYALEEDTALVGLNKTECTNMAIYLDSGKVKFINFIEQPKSKFIPIGQLDGGHVIYGLIGYKRFNQVSPYIFLAFIFYGGLGIVNPGMTYEDFIGWPLVYVLKNWLLDSPDIFPANTEIMHYPWLFAGYLACFFTALNLIPIGQLDGGHVIYGLIGYKRFNQVSPYIFLAFIFYGGLGIVNPGMTYEDFIGWPLVYVFAVFLMLQKTFISLNQRLTAVVSIITVQFLVSWMFPQAEGYYGYLAFAFIIGRFLGVMHPPSLIEEEISLGRKVVGILAIIVFILCFSPVPFTEG